MSVHAPLAGTIGRTVTTSAELIASVSRSTGALLGEKVERSVVELFDEVGFVDDRSADYRVYFNGANFRDDDDVVEVQFIYIGYASKRKCLQITIGKISGDNLALNYGALVNIDGANEDNPWNWFKGGEFEPPVTVRTTASVEGNAHSKLIILDEATFLKTSLDYVRSFKELAVVELKDARGIVEA